MSHKGKIRPLRLAHDSAIRKLEAQAHEAEVAVSNYAAVMKTAVDPF